MVKPHARLIGYMVMSSAPSVSTHMLRAKLSIASVSGDMAASPFALRRAISLVSSVTDHRRSISSTRAAHWLSSASSASGTLMFMTVSIAKKVILPPCSAAPSA